MRKPVERIDKLKSPQLVESWKPPGTAKFRPKKTWVFQESNFSKGLPTLFQTNLDCSHGSKKKVWNWTFFEMDKSYVPVSKLALSEEKYWHSGQSTYCIWFCNDNFHCWVLPSKNLFHQQFLKTIFDFGKMWQLRIWYLDIDTFKSMDARRKILNCTKATWNAFHTCGSLPVSRSQSDCATKKTPLQSSGAGRIVSMF